MSKKLITLTILILCFGIFIIGCSSKEVLPTTLSPEQSIKEIIISKGVNYDFLSDQAYMNYLNTLGSSLITNKLSETPNYAIGNLDEDNIPELAVFIERDPDNIDDDGSLDIYKFDDDKYVLIDSISMNYDNGNNQIIIGKISEEQNGLFLNNSVGAHSGITYGFILKDEKLHSILNENKVSLISVYTNNEIKDIDNDGILEFSIYSVDPETTELSIVGSDKMTLWYKWNGKDSATLVKIERKDYSIEASDKEIFSEAKELIENNFSESLVYLVENKDDLSKYDNTQLLMAYISKIDELNFEKSVEIENLFVKYQEYENFDYLFKKYGLSIEKLNSLEYLNREKVLKDEEELKQHLIKNIKLGYRLSTSEGMYYYLIDHQKLVDALSENISKEYSDYLSILALDTNEPFMNDGSLMISMEKLAERILIVESFKMVYPYSDFLSEINEIYRWYIYAYFYGDNHISNFDYNTSVMKDEVIQEFEKSIEKYQYTNFADIIGGFMESLKLTNNVVNNEIREKLNNRLD